MLAVATGGASLEELKLHKPEWAVADLRHIEAKSLTRVHDAKSRITAMKEQRLAAHCSGRAHHALRSRAVDRTNISLALDPKISSMMRDLLMDDKLAGEVAGIFFIGYVLLQIPGGYWATRLGARKLVSIFLVAWGLCAVGCGMAKTFREFAIMRFLLGVAESGVYPATFVLLANWFPRSERARANSYWNLCQPLAVAGSAPITGWLLKAYSWKQMIVLEGILPFVWLPIWWFCIRDHPSEAKWISPEEREHLETTLKQEAEELESPSKITFAQRLSEKTIYVMVAIYFLHNCAAYGCMTFFTRGLKGRGFSQVQYGWLFAVPYMVTAIIMVLNSWHSDKTHERRGHVAFVLCS